MSRWPLTEGAFRALQRANAVAQGEQSILIEPLHLLKALLQEDSRATELLSQSDITAENFGTAAPGESGDEVAGLSQSRAMRNVLAEARRISSESLGRREIGSEHLLWGLAVVKSPAADLLEQQGFQPESVALRQSVKAEPLEVDFEINWRNDETVSAEPRREVGETVASRPTSPSARFDHAMLRILDAAANRAREGLRVIEDFTRFRLNDSHLTRLLKEARHELAAIFAQLPTRDLLTSRDTPGDVGTGITTPSESIRQSATDVAAANFKRVQEAVRSLEEFGKCLSPDIGRRCEAIRYRLYTLEKAVFMTAASRERLAAWRLYLLLTRSLCRQDPETVLQTAIGSGVDVIQIREKEMPDGELLAWAKRVRGLINDTTDADQRPLLIMNDRPDLAVLCEADGVHVGQDELSVADTRRIVGPERLIGVSTHNIEQARQAALDGADYLGVGPVFPSTTKAFDEFAGLDFVRQVAAEISMPWFAIGGINAINLADVQAAGATRVAVSGAIAGADDPAATTAELRHRLQD